MLLRAMLSFAWLFFAALSVDAQTDDFDRFKDYTPEAIAKMPESERESSVPMILVFAARTGISDGTEIYFSRLLNLLMYSGVSDYQQALIDFQTDLKEEPTGVLTVGQIAEMEKRASLQNITSLYFPSVSYSNLSDHFAIVSGSVTMLEEQISYPINQVKIVCEREERSCEYNQIVVTLPKEDDWSAQYHFHQFDTEYYEITRWENGQIDAVSSNSANSCRINTLSFNFETKEFYEVTKNQNKECDFLGLGSLPPLKKPRISQILDGKDIFESEYEKLRARAYNYLSSSYRSKMDNLIANYQRDADPVSAEEQP